ADVLGWPAGSMSRRLTAARERLRARLERRGVALSTSLLGTLLAEPPQAAVTASLAQPSSPAAAPAATGPALETLVSIQAAALAEGVIQTMFATKLKAGFAVLLVFAAVAVATVLGAPGKPEPNQPLALQDEQPRPANAAKAPADLALVPGQAIGFFR